MARLIDFRNVTLAYDLRLELCDRRPPRREADRFSFLPRPEPLCLPPPLSLLTVAHARRAASLRETPRFS